MPRSLLGFLVILTSCAAVGCNVAGPNVIRGGRQVYNDAIVATNNEQMLSMIVRMRYQEPFGMLAVASVTANVRWQASVGGQAGIGPDQNFAGNLVPFSASALVEENPTISYVPVQGDDYLRQMLSPTPLDMTILVLQSVWYEPHVVALLLEEINGVRHRTPYNNQSSAQDARFEQLAQLLSSLSQDGALTWVNVDGKPHSYALYFRAQRDSDAEDYARLRELLGFAPLDELVDEAQHRIVMGVGAQTDEEVIAIRTRSMYGIFKLAAAAIDVPEEHLEVSLAPRFMIPDDIGFTIRCAERRPANALVAVQHHGWWFWIDATDLKSKMMFCLLEAVVTARVADAAQGHSQTPVLTVPVSR
jgi:hypothetical protein